MKQNEWIVFILLIILGAVLFLQATTTIMQTVGLIFIAISFFGSIIKTIAKN